MNREILFRGKSVDHLGWEFGCLIESCGELFIGNTTGNHPENWCQIIPSTVGQFTGLTDKNGTKIFEGDVICGGNMDNFKVFWDETHSGWNVTGYVNKKVTITSNIHDNPTP